MGERVESGRMQVTDGRAALAFRLGPRNRAMVAGKSDRTRCG